MNSIYQLCARRMHLDAQQLWLNLWTWGLDVQNSAMAIIHANDAVALTRMADDLIAGSVEPSREILEALDSRNDLPVQAAYRLAKRFAECFASAWRVCIHQDATPEMLDELTGHYLALPLLAAHPNTSQCTIDRSVIFAMASGEMTDALHDELVNRASLPLLEALLSHDAPDLIRHSVSRRTQNQRLLRMLAADPDPLIRRNVASNRFTDAGVLSDIVRRDEVPCVLIAAAQCTTNQEDLDVLAERLCGIKLTGLAKAIRDKPHSSVAAKTAAVMIDTVEW